MPLGRRELPFGTVQLQAGCAQLLVSATCDLLGEKDAQSFEKREVSGTIGCETANATSEPIAGALTDSRPGVLP